MPDPPARRGPMSTIAGWMTLIAVLGVAMGLMIVAPPLSILVPIGLIEIVAAKRFMAYRRGGKPMTGCVEAAWILALSILIPILSAVALIVGLVNYYSFMAR